MKDSKMPELLIPDLDPKTLALLSQWAANHGRTVEDEVRVILQQATQELSHRLESGQGSPGTVGCDRSDLQR